MAEELRNFEEEPDEVVVRDEDALRECDVLRGAARSLTEPSSGVMQPMLASMTM